MSSGIISAKAELNALHCDLAEQGFTQVRCPQLAVCL